MVQNIIKESFSFNSSNPNATIKGFKIIPKGKVDAVLIVVHGMIEHSEKYHHFMSFLAENKIACYAHDHLGHKNSVKNKDELGFFSDENGCLNVLEDMNSVFNLAKKENPDKKIFLMGHSMGSFFSRVYAAKYPNTIDALIISGTGETDSSLILGISLVNVISAIKGNKYRSKFVAGLTSKKFMSAVKNPKTNAAWLTRDEEIEMRVANDEYCNFIFTLGAYKDLFEIMKQSSSKKTYKETNKKLPIYIFSGGNDPVGKLGADPLAVYTKYKLYGSKDIKLKIYENARHEMINEINKEEVYQDVLNWINTTTIKISEDI